MSRQTGTVCILLSGILWGMIGIFVKLLSSLGLSTMQTIAVRSLPAVIFIVVVLAVKDKRLLYIAPRDWYYFFATGIFSVMFFNQCYFYTIKASSVSVAAVLLYTAPIFVTLMSSVLFGEKLTVKKLLALALTFTGCVMVSNVLSSSEGIGSIALLTGLGSGFGYALYSIFGRYALKKYHPLTVTLWTIIFAGLGSTVISVAQSGFYLPAELFTAKGFLGCMGMAILCCALPYLLYTSGLAVIESGRASIMATVEPAVAAVIGVCVFSEQLSLINLTGMAMIFLSVFLLAKEN